MNKEKTRPDEPGVWWRWDKDADEWCATQVTEPTHRIPGRWLKIYEPPPPKPVVLPDKPTAFTAKLFAPRRQSDKFTWITTSGGMSHSVAEWFLANATNIKWLGDSDG